MTLTKRMLDRVVFLNGNPCQMTHKGEPAITLIGKTLSILIPMVEIACPDDYIIVRCGGARQVYEEGELAKSVLVDGVEVEMPESAVMNLEIGKNVPVGTPIQMCFDGEFATVGAVGKNLNPVPLGETS